jgi:hypothetical protein
MSRIQYWGSVAFFCGSGSGFPDPYLLIMEPDPDPTPDPAPFFSDFKDAKKNSHFFLITYPEAHYLRS